MDIGQKDWGCLDETSLNSLEKMHPSSGQQFNITQDNIETVHAVIPGAAVESEAIPLNGAVQSATPLKGVAIAAGSYVEFMRHCQPTSDEESVCPNSELQDVPAMTNNFAIAKPTLEQDNHDVSTLRTNGEGLDVTGIEAVGNFDDFMSKHKGKNLAL